MRRVRIFFDSLSSAAEGLILLLEFARDNKDVDFRFGPMTARGVLESGLWAEGQIDELADSLDKIPGAVSYFE